jgi:hypothetical protein
MSAMDLFTPSFFLSIGIVVMLLALLAIFLLRRIQAIHDETVMAFDLVTITAQQVSKINQFLVMQQQQQQPKQPAYPITVDEEIIEDDEDEDEDEDDDEDEDNEDIIEEDAPRADTSDNIKIIILSTDINDIDEDVFGASSVSDEHDIEELDDMEMDLKQSVAEEDAAIHDIDETVLVRGTRPAQPPPLGEPTVRPVHVEVDYKTLKLPELRKYASEHGVTHVHNMKKNELLVAIEQLTAQ